MIKRVYHFVGHLTVRPVQLRLLFFLILINCVFRFRRQVSVQLTTNVTVLSHIAPNFGDSSYLIHTAHQDRSKLDPISEIVFSLLVDPITCVEGGEES